MFIKLPKKGDISDCTNWRGITLLSVPGMVFCLIILNRLREAVDETLCEEQAGLCRGRSCTEQIFTLRQKFEHCVEFQQPLSINFINFKKAFDSVHRQSPWNIARLY